jgi:hypothetical protein
LIVAFAGCSSHGRSLEESTASTRAALITHNGFTENGLSSNGFTENGFTENGFTENGFTENGFTENGFTENGFTENGFTENGLSAIQIMENDPNAVEFAQYAYSCAMPPGHHVTLTINGSPVDFDGSLGLAPEWENGPCQFECQRWISACMLARVNAYGVHVKLSLRAPRAQLLANGDTEAYNRTQYLELSDSADPTLDESTLYPLREGAYFGNIFDSADGGNGTLVHAPKYYACSGPGSSIPQLTKRFCSGQGDDCIIFTGSEATWSDCLTGPHSCAGLDGGAGPDGGKPSEAVHDCQSPDGAVAFKQVLTVYLAHPITVCGNGICEGSVPDAIYGDGAVPEDSTNCPQDCHPGTWAKAVDLIQPNPCISGTCLFGAQNGDNFNPGRRFAITPTDNIVRLLDKLPGSGSGISFGTEDGPFASAPGQSSIVAVYDKLGLPIDSTLFQANSDITNSRAVTTDGDANIIVMSYGPLAVSKLDPTGAPIWMSTSFPAANGATTAGPVTTDASGNIFAAWSQTIVGAAAQITLPAVTKFLPDGTPSWTIGLQPPDPNVAVDSGAITTDAAGNVYMTDVGNIYKILPDGTFGWAKGASTFGGIITFTGLGVDGAGNVYAAGRCTDSADFDLDPTTPPIGPGFFVVKFGQPDGTFAWTYFVPQVFVSFPAAALLDAIAVRTTPVTPVDVHVDVDGNVVVAGGFFGNGTVPNFGPGPFDTEGSPDTFVVALSPTDGTYVWAKSLPLYSGGGTDGLMVGHSHQIFVTGGFDASMLLDSQQLINSHPERLNNQNLFVGAFTSPCGTPGCDTIAPVFDQGTVPGAALPPGNVTSVGNPIIVYATSQAGAIVHYTLPLATNAVGDPNYDGANIVCSPHTGTTFPIGVTTVTCTANDPHGNTSSTTFPITVLGTAGPILLNLPKGFSIDAPTPAGVVVTYQPPTATDQVDGTVPVTCAPASGSVFPVGTTTVDCSAADLATPPNVTHGKFDVQVKFIGPPVITVPTPSPLVVDATKPTGANVTYGASAKDAGGNSIPVNCTPPSGSPFPLGLTTVNCTATDQFGNTATASFVVQVRFAGFQLLPPVKPTGSVFHFGQTIPVRFQLNPNIANAKANLTLAKVVNGVAGPEQNAVSSGNANQGNLFRYDPHCKNYIFNLSTKPLSTGVWRLRIDLHDGVTHTVDITLKTNLSFAEELAAEAGCGCDD